MIICCHTADVSCADDRIDYCIGTFAIHRSMARLKHTKFPRPEILVSEELSIMMICFDPMSVDDQQLANDCADLMREQSQSQAPAGRPEGEPAGTTKRRRRTKAEIEAASGPAMPAAPAMTQADVSTELTRALSVHSHSALLACMQQITGVTELSRVPADKYAALIEAIKSLPIEAKGW